MSEMFSGCTKCIRSSSWINCTLLIVGSLQAQTILYESNGATSDRITVLNRTSSPFTSELNSFSISPDTRNAIEEAVTPYLLIVKNNSATAIVRLVWRCEIERLNKAPIVWMHTLNQGASSPTERLRQGQSVMLFPGLLRAGASYAAGNPVQLQELGKELSEAKALRISLDAAIFEDGTLVGVDKSGAAVRYSAEKNTLSAIVEELRGGQANEDSADKFSAWTTSLAASQPRSTMPLEETNRDLVYIAAKVRRTIAIAIASRKLSLSSAISFVEAMERTIPRLRSGRPEFH